MKLRKNLQLDVRCDGKHIKFQADLFAIDASGEVVIESITAHERRVSNFLIDHKLQPHSVRIRPVDPGAWSTYYEPTPSCWSYGIKCDPLPKSGPFGWWHELLGVTDGTARGDGIRIGVVDHPFHPQLAPAGLRTVEVPGIDPPPQAQISERRVGHGAAVCALIKSDPPSGSGCYEGLCPNCDLYFASCINDEFNVDTFAVASAIRTLSLDHGVDLINASLGDSITPTNEIYAAVSIARDNGTLVLFAAGNGAGPLLHPAKDPECIAVGAVGMRNWGSRSSMSRFYAENARKFGTQDLFLWLNSAIGPELDLVAPGVGIIASLAGSHNYDYSGTSYSSPIATGVLACALSMDETYKTLPRTIERTKYAERILFGLCRDIGMSREEQGRGLPVFDAKLLRQLARSAIQGA